MRGKYVLSLIIVVSLLNGVTALNAAQKNFVTSLSNTSTWARSYGEGDKDMTRAVLETDEGNYLIAGHTRSFDANNYDYWVMELNTLGEINWQKTFGGTNLDMLHSMQKISTGGYILAGITQSFGASDSNYWLVKITNTGDLVWKKSFGGANYEWLKEIQETSTGDFVTVGYTYYSETTRDDALVTKHSSNGEIIWQKTYGGSGKEQARSILETTDGDYVVAGISNSPQPGNDDILIMKLNSSGVVLWQKTYGGPETDWASSIKKTADNNYIILGQTTSFGAGNWDYWILKIDDGGTVLWQKTYGGDDADEAWAIQETYDNGYVVAGNTRSFGLNTIASWILKLDNNGDILWEYSFDGNSSDYLHDVMETEGNNLIFVGNTQSFGAGREDAWVLKTDSTGNIATCDITNETNATVTETAVTGQGASLPAQQSTFTIATTSPTSNTTTAQSELICFTPIFLTLSGQVVDAAGYPLKNIQVIETNFALTQTTNFNGEYSFLVPPGTYELTLDSNSHNFIPMLQEIEVLDYDVVVTAFQAEFPEPFLDLPLMYSFKGTPYASAGFRNEFLTRLNAVFDHAGGVFNYSDDWMLSYLGYPLLHNEWPAEPCGPPNTHCYDGHEGYDFSRFGNTMVYPAADGEVIYNGWLGAYGNAVQIDHLNGFTTLYGHLANPAPVSVGNWVTSETKLGQMGTTGQSTGVHLHFHTRYNNRLFDPSGWLDDAIDPWSEHPQGTRSVSMWKYPVPSPSEWVVNGSEGGSFTSEPGNITVYIAPNAFSGEKNFTFTEVPIVDPNISLRSTGYSFIFEETQEYQQNSVVEIVVAYKEEFIDTPTEIDLGIYYWDVSNLVWLLLPANVDTVANTITVSTDMRGMFSVFYKSKFVYLPIATR